MTCEECKQILLDSTNSADQKGIMPTASVLNLARSHAQNCLVCASKMSEIARLNDALDQLRAATLYTKPSALAEMKLLAAFRRETTSRASSVTWAFPGRFAWGSAAVLLVVAAALIVSLVLRTRSAIAIKTGGTHGEQLAEKQLSPALPRGTAGSVAIGRQSPNGNHAAVSLGRAVSSGREGAKVAKATHQPIRPSFQQVVGDELALNGGSNVVRVTLPLSSLVAMGVPVYPEMSDRRVTADVMMDPFGAVVAVRFVEARPAAD